MWFKFGRKFGDIGFVEWTRQSGGGRNASWLRHRMGCWRQQTGKIEITFERTELCNLSKQNFCCVRSCIDVGIFMYWFAPNVEQQLTILFKRNKWNMNNGKFRCWNKYRHFTVRSIATLVRKQRYRITHTCCAIFCIWTIRWSIFANVVVVGTRN